MKISWKKVKEAADKIGFKIVPGITYDSRKKICCPLAAIVKASLPRNKRINGLDNHFSLDFISGFTFAFDTGIDISYIADNKAYMSGFKQGLHCRKMWLKEQE